MHKFSSDQNFSKAVCNRHMQQVLYVTIWILHCSSLAVTTGFSLSVNKLQSVYAVPSQKKKQLCSLKFLLIYFYHIAKCLPSSPQWFYLSPFYSAESAQNQTQHSSWLLWVQELHVMMCTMCRNGQNLTFIIMMNFI